jgi:RNA polymerase sigma factor (sigma-70 family)
MLNRADWTKSLAALPPPDRHAANHMIPLLIAWARRELGPREKQDQEDIIAEFLCRVNQKNFANLSVVAPLAREAYLRRALASCLIDHQRRQARLERREGLCCEWTTCEEGEETALELDDLPGSAEDPLDVVLRREAVAALWAVVAELSDVNRRIVAGLATGLSYAAIGRLLGLQPHEVKWHVQSIRRQLKRRLEKRAA